MATWLDRFRPLARGVQSNKSDPTIKSKQRFITTVHRHTPHFHRTNEYFQPVSITLLSFSASMCHISFIGLWFSTLQSFSILANSSFSQPSILSFNLNAPQWREVSNSNRDPSPQWSRDQVSEEDHYPRPWFFLDVSISLFTVFIRVHLFIVSSFLSWSEYLFVAWSNKGLFLKRSYCPALRSTPGP